MPNYAAISRNSADFFKKSGIFGTRKCKRKNDSCDSHTARLVSELVLVAVRTFRAGRLPRREPAIGDLVLDLGDLLLQAHDRSLRGHGRPHQPPARSHF